VISQKWHCRGQTFDSYEEAKDYDEHWDRVKELAQFIEARRPLSLYNVNENAMALWMFENRRAVVEFLK
jgi:dsDNA-binding SOS-regulon protein